MARTQLKCEQRSGRALAPIIAVLALALTACGGPVHSPIVVGTTYPNTPDTTVDPTAASPPETSVPAPAPVTGARAGALHTGRGLPVEVDVPAIGVHATSIMITGLDHGAPAVPPTSKPQTLAAYGYGSPPCSSAAAQVPFVLLGHIDGGGAHGVLYDLKSTKPGDMVTVKLDNGTSCEYRITKFASFDKKKLVADGAESVAAKEMWGPVPAGGQIRVISCGGAFVGAPLYYADNLVAEGSLIS